jgi:hypothetical protein
MHINCENSCNSAGEYFFAMQDSLQRLTAYAKAFDDSKMLGAPAELLMLQHYYEKVGERFTLWLHHEPDALHQHLQSVREAAHFSSDLADKITSLDSSAKLKVRCHAFQTQGLPLHIAPCLKGITACAGSL